MSKRERPKADSSLTVMVTTPQRDWLEAQVPPGGSVAAVVRALIEKAMKDSEVKT